MDEELRKKILADATTTAQRATAASVPTNAPIDLRTRMGGENAPYGFGQPSGFASFNPAPSVRPIPFGGTGVTRISPEGLPLTTYPSRTDITGRVGGVSALSLTPSTTPFVSEQGPMLAPSPQGFTPFTPFGERVAPLPSALPLAQTMRIEGGPVSLTGATAMTSPQTAEQQGRVASALRAGTVYATPEQLANLSSGVGGFSGQRTPAQQQALIAQMREKGRSMAGAQERFFTEKRQAREGVRAGEIAAREAGYRPMDIIRGRAAAAGPSSIAGIQREASPYQAGPRPSYGMTAAQQFYGSFPSGGPQPLRSTSTGASGYALYEQQQAARRAAGMTGPYSNLRAERRRQEREMARLRALQPTA